MTVPVLPMMQPGQSGPAGGYSELKDIFDQAVDFLHGRTKSGKRYSQAQVDQWVRSTVGQGSPIRSFQQLASTLQGLDRAGAKPVSQDDLSPLERGALARLALVGHGASFGWSDELSGLTNVLGALRNGNIHGLGGEYRRGRDEARQYFDQAREAAANRGILNPEMWGGFGTAVALGGQNPQPMGLLKGAGVGGGLSLASSLGELPDVSPETLRENAVPLALNTALGAVLGGGGSLLGKRGVAMRAPGALKLDKALEATGGAGGLADAVERAGTPRPMLGELQETTFGRLGQEIRRVSAEATSEALDRVQTELQGVQQAKQAVGQQYDLLQTPIQSDRAAEILATPRVSKMARTLVQDGVINPGEPLTGRALEDIRQEVAAQSRRAYARGNARVGKLLKSYARELQDIIDNSAEGMPQVREQYAPLAQRERTLLDMQRRLSRAARGSGIPVESKVTTHSELLQELGGEPWQRAMRAARQMAGPLYTPGTAAEHLSRLHGMMPWYSRLGNVGAAAAPAVPQLTDPFFPLRQLTDSTRQ